MVDKSHFKLNSEKAVAKITCACGEKHTLASTSDPMEITTCECGRTYVYFTTINCGHESHHEEIDFDE